MVWLFGAKWSNLRCKWVDFSGCKKRTKYTDLDVFRAYKNQLIAKERARVEHVFAALKTVFKFSKLRYRGLERVTSAFESLIIAYNFYRLFFYWERGLSVSNLDKIGWFSTKKIKKYKKLEVILRIVNAIFS